MNNDNSTLLSSLITEYLPELKSRYGYQLSTVHYQTLNAIIDCRQGRFGEVALECSSCQWQQHVQQSCGNRHCPQCQNDTTTQWLERQRAKLLPVDYFMATFTLPRELRYTALNHQKIVYSALFKAASSTLKTFGINSKLNIDLGLCAVLHTHSRRLDYHPHLHVVVTGGGINASRKQWKKLNGRYLFNAFQLASVFRAKMLKALALAGLSVPTGIRDKWVVDCRHVGNGLPAITYLSKYLYRGVIQPKQIINHDARAKTVTFRYQDSQTNKTAYRTLTVVEFLYKLTCHILPKGFRRVREYGFLHPNSKRLLKLVQLVLNVKLVELKLKPRPHFKCPKCQFMMIIKAFIPRPKPT